ncbi:DinB family protein [Sinomicrobium weinanense]|uniref:DinB family protein n=1 Tax=Sinomicrobium weinanense TaxID=2842200 RepID=A0A926JUY8_9FLAO|nr:DinB family protein [Sinomicrobium weinanense]MBC9797789.1 DinB family protein [Sinomicrobium weinanense]MBU3124873.1 DinB family protein [Sinomicrobium weinanense]
MKYTPKDGFSYYFELAKGDTLQSIFSVLPTLEFLQSIDEEKAKFRYKPNKWSIKQIVGHITDHERIKMFRAFQLSRNEKIQLWGYDQEFLVNNSRFNELSMQLLLADFLNVRKASVSFIDTLSKDQLQRKGWARQYKITLEEFLRSIIGHERHHINIIREKYCL